MTCKDLHIAIKNGLGYEEVMTKFNYSDKESLYKAIRHFSPTGANEFIRGLEKNQANIDKRRKNKMNKKTVEVAVNEQSIPEAHLQQETNTETTAVSEEVFAAQNVTEIPHTNDIEQLRNDESYLSDLLCKLEGEHKSIVAKRGSIHEELVKSTKVLEDIQQMLRYQQTKVSKLCEEYAALAMQMQKINTERGEYNQILVEVRKKLEELTKPRIFVYANGEIEVENADILQVPDEKISSIVNYLITFPDAENFTIKEVKALAKLQEMLAEYRKKEITFELSFEKQEVQCFFDSVAFLS